MDSNSLRRFEMFKRVHDFGVAHASNFAEGSLSKELFGKIAGTVTKLESQSTSQLSGRGAAQTSAKTKGAIRDELRDLLIAINRTARSLAIDMPGLDNKFRHPRAGTDQALLTAARAFAADAAPLKDHFIRHEMPSDFVEKLNQLINAFELATTEKHAAVGAHRTAKIALDESIEAGSQVVRQLDVIVRNKFSGEPAVLAEWARASTVVKRTRSAEAVDSTNGDGEQEKSSATPNARSA